MVLEEYYGIRNPYNRGPGVGGVGYAADQYAEDPARLRVRVPPRRPKLVFSATPERIGIIKSNEI